MFSGVNGSVNPQLQCCYALGCFGVKKGKLVKKIQNIIGYVTNESPPATMIRFLEWVHSGVKESKRYHDALTSAHKKYLKNRELSLRPLSKRDIRDGVVRKKYSPATAGLTLTVPKIGAPHKDYTDSKVFYASDAWKKLRYLALKAAEGRCLCCGASAKDGAVIHVDHIIPRWVNPTKELDLSNLQVLCEACNQGKGAWDSTDWR